MENKSDLEDYLPTYDNDPFCNENLRMLNAYVDRCIRYSKSRLSYLELGIGNGLVLQRLAEHFEQVVVVEGAESLVEQYADRHQNVEVTGALFEEYEPTQGFDNIGMGFVLEHVEFPAEILKKFAGFLQKDGCIFIGVPSASSLHRILAVKAGLLADINQMSETDYKFGHRRFLTYQEWVATFASVGLQVVRSEGLYLKPFSTSQIEQLGLPDEVFDALENVAVDYPELSNSLFFELKMA